MSPFAVADEPASSWRRLLRSRRFRAAAPLLALFVACAVAPGVVAPADPHSCDLARSAAPPVAGHPFGFDPLGCDYLSRVVYGARTSLGVAVLVVGGALLIAIVLGLLAGLRGGALDIAISRFADVLLGVPLVLGGLVVLAVLETRGVLQVSAVLTLLTWPALLRVVRVAVREQQAATFVEAARAMGASELRVAIHHVLAGAVGPVLVYATALSGVVIAAEATLSFMASACGSPPCHGVCSWLPRGPTSVRHRICCCRVSRSPSASWPSSSWGTRCAMSSIHPGRAGERSRPIRHRRDQSDAAVSALIGRRLLQGAVTLLMATLLIHAAVILIPGDPIRAIWGQSRPPPAAVADIRDRYHLDDPYPLQYVKWLADLARGDLGISYPFAAVGSAVVAEGVPVAGTIAAAAPVSARLLGVAAAAQLLLGVGAGLGAVMAARSPSLRARVMRVPATGRHHDALGAVRRHVDGIMYGGAVIAAAAPAILVAYTGQIVFGHRLQWLPVQGLHQGWVSYVLPIVAMALASIGYVALVTRRALMDVLHELFVTAAVARGMSDRRVIVVHALRPALPSILALAAANLGVLVASQIIVEGVFALPGVGNLIFEAIRRHDMPLLVPSVTLVIALVIVANLAADVAAAANPRMRGLD